jgi:hypothetical protein
VRIGVDASAPKELVAKLRELGAVPKEVGPRPTVAGMGGGALGVEGAAAFDEYVQRKAKETGLDLASLPEPAAGGARGGGQRGGAAGGGTGGAPANPMAPADWNPRFVRGRTTRAFEYVQSQRRRYILISKWADYMKELDLFIGGPQADVGANAQTGHPCVVVPYRFDVPQQGGGRGGSGAQPPPALKPQPICAVIVGNLFADDIILSVAHQLQIHTDVHLKHPAL